MEDQSVTGQRLLQKVTLVVIHYFPVLIEVDKNLTVPAAVFFRTSREMYFALDDTSNSFQQFFGCSAWDKLFQLRKFC